MADIFKDDAKLEVLYEKMDELDTFVTEKKDEISTKVSELNQLLSAAGLSVSSSSADTSFDNVSTTLGNIKKSITGDNSMIDEFNKSTGDEPFETVTSPQVLYGPPPNNDPVSVTPTGSTETQTSGTTPAQTTGYSGGYSGGTSGGGGYSGGYSSGGGYSGGSSGYSQAVASGILASNVLTSQLQEEETVQVENETTTNDITEQLNNSVNSGSITFGNYSMSNYPTGNTEQECIVRAALVTKYLAANGGFTMEQAAGLAGVFLDENMCNPSGTCYDGGMGIQSWTRSVKTMAMQAYGTTTPINQLNLQQQCDMIIATAKPGQVFATYYDALKRCETVEDAAATAIVLTGGVGYSNNWSTHPTAQEARNCINVYINYNGASAYTLGAYDRRMSNGQKILDAIKNDSN